MDKEDFVRRFSRKGYTLAVSYRIIDDLTEAIIESLMDGVPVSLHGFGSFEVREYKGRHLGDESVPESILDYDNYKYPKFRPGLTFKRAIRSGVYHRHEKEHALVKNKIGGIIGRGERVDE